MVGIAGIGMSALAQLYATRGYTVQGSDRSNSRVTTLLAQRGIVVFTGHDAAHVPEEASCVVFSDAVPEDNPERVRARELGIRELSYFEALGEATKEGASIVVSGTHGKTTTTAMLAKILIDADKEPTVIAGSILSEYGSNFVAGKPDLFVIEGCEYRRHFLHLHPTILVINNIELDHTDYYKDIADMQDAFRSAVALLPKNGVMVTNTDASTITPVVEGAHTRVVAYQHATVPQLQVPGIFNGENAQAAKTAALVYDSSLDPSLIDSSLASFTGTWRRFEYKGTMAGGAVVYDDYAHHPTAVQSTVDMVRTEFPGKRIVVVFHPHLYTRTRDCMDGFVEALSRADEVLLAPIYPAREAPIPGITSEVLAERVHAQGTPAHAFASLKAIDEYMQHHPHLSTTDTIVMLMGAGDVYTLADAWVEHTNGQD